MKRPLLLSVTALLAVAYVTSSVLIAAHSKEHLVLKLTVIQYAFLLPAAVCYLLYKRIPDGRMQSRTTWSVAASYLTYAVLATFLALGVIHKDRGLQFGDELGYRFESRVFLDGRLAADAPPKTTPDGDTYLNEFHFDHFIIHENRWTAQYPPGWPAVLALGTLLHQDWLLNPLLGLWILWITYNIAILVFDENVGRLAVFFMIASPSFLLNSVGFMSHPLCGVLLAAASLFLFHGLESGRMRDFLIMLLLVALAALVRPWTAFCVGTVLGVTALWSLRHRRRRLLSLIAIATLVGAAPTAILLAYNHALTGSYWQSTYALAENHTFTVAFNVSPVSILKTVAVATRWSLEQTDFYTVPFLLLLATYAVFAETGRRRDAYILGTLFAALVIGYTAQPIPSGSTVGERYYYESFFAVAILGARGWSLLRTRWSLHFTWVATVTLIAVSCFHYAVAINTVRNRVTPHIRVMDAIEGLRLTDAVVYLKGDFATHFNHNAADWRHAPVFYMVDPGPSRRAVVAGALQRSAWVVVSYDAEKQWAHVDSSANPEEQWGNVPITDKKPPTPP
jgi:hypothetical protein